jgi:hypothetical protein
MGKQTSFNKDIKSHFRLTPWPQYVGVHASYHTIFTKQILQYLTGDIVPDLPENKVKSYYY